MRTSICIALVLGSLAVFGCGGGRHRQEAIEQAYEAIDALYDNEASDEEKLAATVDFLESYPESEHTVGLVGDVLYFKGEKAGDMGGAIEFAEKTRAAVTVPTIAMDFDRHLISWYGMAGMRKRMLSVADRLERDGTIRFGDYFNVIESAVEMADWKLVRKYCSKAQPKANTATWRAEWPDFEATDERAEAAGLNRQGMLLVKDSWARANLGDVDGALAGFVRAEELLDSSYLGIPGFDLNSYWGKALVMNGDAEGAIEKFAPDALIVGDDDAVAALKQAYVTVNGSEDGYRAWSCRKRLKIAKQANDFELPDANGARHRFADLRGEVTLLNLWSST